MCRLDQIKIFVCLTMFVTCWLIGCDSSAQRHIDKTARAIQDSLYIPREAVFLGAVQSNEFLAYAKGCTGTHIELVYGINRSIEEVVAEYKQQLLGDGWIPHPGYDTEGATDYFFFQKGIETSLGITALPVLVSLDDEVIEQFSTIYVVNINYVEPSYSDCVG